MILKEPNIAFVSNQSSLWKGMLANQSNHKINDKVTESRNVIRTVTCWTAYLVDCLSLVLSHCHGLCLFFGCFVTAFVLFWVIFRLSPWVPRFLHPLRPELFPQFWRFWMVRNCLGPCHICLPCSPFSLAPSFIFHFSRISWAIRDLTQHSACTSPSLLPRVCSLFLKLLQQLFSFCCKIKFTFWSPLCSLCFPGTNLIPLWQIFAKVNECVSLFLICFFFQYLIVWLYKTSRNKLHPFLPTSAGLTPCCFVD